MHQRLQIRDVRFDKVGIETDLRVRRNAAQNLQHRFSSLRVGADTQDLTAEMHPACLRNDGCIDVFRAEFGRRSIVLAFEILPRAVRLIADKDDDSSLPGKARHVGNIHTVAGEPVCHNVCKRVITGHAEHAAGSAEPRGYIEHDAGVGARIGSREIRGHVKRNVSLFAHDFHHWETNCQNIVLQIMLLPFQITHHTSLYVCDVLCCSMLYWLHVSTSCCICKCILNRKCAI